MKDFRKRSIENQRVKRMEMDILVYHSAILKQKVSSKILWKEKKENMCKKAVVILTSRFSTATPKIETVGEHFSVLRKAA